MSQDYYIELNKVGGFASLSRDGLYRGAVIEL